MKYLLYLLLLLPFISNSQIAGTSTRTYDGVSRNFQVYRPGDYLSGSHPLWITGKGATEASTPNATPYTFEAYGRAGASMRFFNTVRGAYSTQYVVTIEEFPTAASVRAALVYAKANLPNLDTTQMVYWGLSVSGGLADEIATDTGPGGLANRFACVVNSCGIVNVTVAAAMSGVLSTHLGYIAMGSVNDENGSTAPMVPNHQDYLNTNGLATPAQKTYWLTSSNGTSFHVGGWFNAQDTTPGNRTMWVDSARWTGHTAATNVSISMRSIAEQVLTYQRYNSNASPTANPGSTQTITLPTNSVTLTGSGTDTDGTIAGYSWTKTSGPSTFTIVSPSSSTTNITGLVAGTYVFTLTVTDNLGATGSAGVTIIVNPAPNSPPTVTVGADRTINTKCTPSTSITATGADSDGSIATYAWTKLSGPNTPTTSGASTATINLSNLITGTYSYKVLVTDNLGATGADTLSLFVHNPTAYTYGTLFGSVTLSPTSSSPTMVPGDTLIVPGRYTSVSYSNFNASCDSFYIKFTNDTAMYNQSSYASETMTNCNSLKIDGFHRYNSQRTLILGTTVANLRLTNWRIINDTSHLQDTQYFIQIGTTNNAAMLFDGIDKEKTYHDIRIDHSNLSGIKNAEIIKVNNNGYYNILLSPKLDYDTCRNVTNTSALNPLFFSGVALDFDFHNIILDSLMANSGAFQGVHGEWFLVWGYGKFYNNYARNSYGSLLRAIPLRWNALGYTGNNAFLDIHDNIAYNNLAYSMFESNLTAPLVPSSYTSSGFSKTRTKAYFNTFVKSRIATYSGDYNANIMDIFADTVSVRNNVNVMPGIDRTFDQIINNYVLTGVYPALDSGGNRVYQNFTTSGYFDSTSFTVTGSSPLRGGADNSAPTSASDFYGTTRPSFPNKTVGAVQYVAPTTPPTADDGGDKNIQGTNMTTLLGSGTPAIGAVIVGYGWSKVSGPTVTIVDPTSATTDLVGLMPGTYIMRLIVTDNNGLTGTNDATIVVQRYSYKGNFTRKP